MPSWLGPAEILVVLIVVVGPPLWIWMLIDCLKYESSDGNTKMVWVLVIVLAGGVGALIYLLMRRQKRIQELGR